jgi:hypothetical protein
LACFDCPCGIYWRSVEIVAFFHNDLLQMAVQRGS